MITLTVSESPLGKRYPVQDIAVSWLGQTRSVPAILLSAISGNLTYVFEREYGYMHRGEKAAVGRMRDKEVYHTSLSGDLMLSNHSYLVDIVGTFPRAKRSNGVFVPYRAVEEWGLHAGVGTYQLVWSDVLYQGDHYSATRTCSSQWIYIDDYLIVDWTVIAASATKNGAPISISTGGGITSLYHRVGGIIKLLKSQSHVTGDLVAWYNTNKGIVGAEALGYSDLLVSSWGDPASISNEVFAKLAPLRNYHPFEVVEPVDFGELAVECARQKNFIDSNILLLVVDINDWTHFHSLWKGLTNVPGWKRAKRLFHSLVRTGKMSKREFAQMFNPMSSLYLFSKYAVLPNVSDVKRIAKGTGVLAARPLSNRLHSRREVPLDVPNAILSSYTATITVECGAYPDSLMGFIQSLIGQYKRWGVYPAPANLHDLIPYSFVVDGFVGFGDVLKQEQRYLDVKNYFPVHHCVLSSKWQAVYSSTVLVPEYPVTGDVAIKQYHRWITSEVPLPTVDPLQFGSGPISHWVESGALVLQRL
jgi:hypothetical protein